MDAEDVAAYRAMTLEQRLERGFAFLQRVRQFKVEALRVHHPGWSEEKVRDELRRWTRDGMNPAELYEWYD